jgi:hypothetical protein
MSDPAKILMEKFEAGEDERIALPAHTYGMSLKIPAALYLKAGTP